ncbi:MAG: tetratricopeptide repeat protein [Planctomycetes bacterium]|nr:tetratricopeptide repeat protein [Planctomycetota bacterium]
MTSPAECPPFEDIEQLVAERLEAATSARIRTHLTTCITCSRQEAELRADRELGERLRRSLGGMNDERSPVIAGYTVVREVGRGGMGVVYEAEQHAPKRRVALKVVRGVQFVDAHTLRLFQREISVLARLEHPGIATLYGAGETKGEHWFAMEFVNGKPLTVHVEALGRSDRLERFLQLCDAIDYAHRHGVVHRDLKPTNVLVTDAGRVQVLDFGLAKITDVDVSHATETGHIRGTLAYMSPEQARGDPSAIGLQSDVYSLGVILYELLCDALPIDTSGVAIHEAARRVALEAPRRPSAIVPALRGDLETIVLKALEKDAHRRYASVAALADDVRRFRANKVILARPPSSLYELKKLIARHQAVFALAAVVVFGAIGTAIWTSILYTRESALLSAQTDLVAQREAALQSEQDQRIRAETAAEYARNQTQVAERRLVVVGQEAEAKREGLKFLVDIFADVRAPGGRGGQLTALELLKRGIARLIADKEKSPFVRITLLQAVGRAATNAGLLSEASTLLEEGLQLVREHAAGKSMHATLAADLGILRRLQGRSQESLVLLRESADVYAEAEGATSENAISARVNLTQAYRDSGEARLAIESAKELISITPASEAKRERRLNLHTIIALSHNDLREFDEARRYLETGLAEFGANDPSIGFASTLNTYGIILLGQGQLDAARARFKEALDIRLQLLDPDHDLIAESYNNLGAVEYQVEDFAASADYLEKSWAIQVKRLGPNSTKVALAESNRAGILVRLGDYGAAEALASHALEVRRAAYGNGHVQVADTLVILGDLAVRRGRLEQAEAYLSEAVAIFDKKYGRRHPDTIEARFRLAQSSVAGEHWETARSRVDEALADARATHSMPVKQLAEIETLASMIGRASSGAQAPALISK